MTQEQRNAKVLDEGTGLRTCPQCQERYSPVTGNQKFCSDFCKHDARHPDWSPSDDLRTGTGQTMKERADYGLAAPVMKRVMISKDA